MEKARRIFANALFFTGIIIMFGVIGTDDFYRIELGEFQPFNWRLFFEGALMIVPKLLR